MAKASSISQSAATEAQTSPKSILDDIVEQSKLGSDDTDKAKELIRDFSYEFGDGSMPITDAEMMINARIAELDFKLSLQVNEILHDKEFQQLEGSWRGLEYLTKKSNTGPALKIRVWNATKNELSRDIGRATEFDQSALFKKVYEEEYGVLGGAPYGALIGDYEFGLDPEDIALLKGISAIASQAHAPFISAAAPSLFGMKSFTALDKPRALSKVFENTEYVGWNSFRNSDESRYVALCLPRVLGRLPYGAKTAPIEEFRYEEKVDGTDHSKYLWMNAAYALGAKMTESFSEYGMCVAMRGVEGGGAVDDLPAHVFSTAAGETELKCPTEIQISDRREEELAQLGFVPLLHRKGTDQAVFMSVQSCEKPKSYDTDGATANAALSAQLPYMMAVSRFAHYLKAIGRDKIGSFTSRSQAESELRRWIERYVTPDPTASAEAKAKRPLREARIDVEDIPGKPGRYNAIAYLCPHFQLDGLTASLRLVAELPAGKK